MVSRTPSCRVNASSWQQLNWRCCRCAVFGSTVNISITLGPWFLVASVSPMVSSSVIDGGGGDGVIQRFISLHSHLLPKACSHSRLRQLQHASPWASYYRRGWYQLVSILRLSSPFLLTRPPQTPNHLLLQHPNSNIPQRSQSTSLAQQHQQEHIHSYALPEPRPELGRNHAIHAQISPSHQFPAN